MTRLEPSSALNQVNNQDDDRNHEQQGHRGTNLISDALPFGRARRAKRNLQRDSACFFG
jgi:hypothetical protein